MIDHTHNLQHELRSGAAPWRANDGGIARAPLSQSFACDVLIVGGGITGSLIAQRLATSGRRVSLVDRVRPGFGSTAASTAMLQWEIDRTLRELTELYGFERAAAIYRISLEAVAGLTTLVGRLRLACDFRARSSLYLAAVETPARELSDEHALRRRAGLPGEYLDGRELKQAFGFERASAIHSGGCAEADPLELSRALLRVAESQGVRIFDAEALEYSGDAKRAYVGFDGGHVIEAAHVILATGYVMPAFVETRLHQTASSWAICSVPQPPERLWRDRALVWESSTPYLYMRTTADHRVVVGGEDEPGITNPEQRDVLTPGKARSIAEKLRHLAPELNVQTDFVWSGEFGETGDGLPLIGGVPGHPRFLAAYGYGGNGITFSFLAARMLERLIEGEQRPWFDTFALDRPGVETSGPK